MSKPTNLQEAILGSLGQYAAIWCSSGKRFYGFVKEITTVSNQGRKAPRMVILAGSGDQRLYRTYIDAIRIDAIEY